MIARRGVRSFAAAVRDIAAYPIAVDAAGSHVHQH
jgi:hypothetical protein